MTSWKSIIPPLLEAAQSAAERIMAIYQQEDLGVEYKNDASPLTLADQASHQVLQQALPGIVDCPVLSEESEQAAWKERKKWSRCWIVDPLDGTKEFVSRNGEFAINIALVEDGKVVAAVVHLPALREAFWAVQGGGAWHRREDGSEKALRCRTMPASYNDDEWRILASRSHLNEETKAFLSQYPNAQLTQAGSALKFLHIAQGQADLYPRLGPTMEWDTAAPQLIVEEAGGKVLVYPQGIPLTYNREDLLNPSFVVWGKIPE